MAGPLRRGTARQALLLDRPWSYLAAALRGRGDPTTYRLRSTGVAVVLRHGTADIATFNEIFRAHIYEPPPAAASALADRALSVADLGANVGLFGAYVLGRWPGSRIVALEPDPANLRQLRHCVAANGAQDTWRVIPAAAAASRGELGFVAGRGPESHIAGGHEAEDARPVEKVDVFDLLDHVDLLKIDIEGGEWELLCDPRLATLDARVIVLEHHGRHCPTRDPRATATDLLQRAGYAVTPGGPDQLGVGMVWAWRSASPRRG